jgi:hypothetical protein
MWLGNVYMTLDDFFAQNGAAIIIAIGGSAIASIPGIVTAFGLNASRRRADEMKRMLQFQSDTSSRNEVAIQTVHIAQNTNRVEIKNQFQGLQHAFSNGLGDHLADRAATKTVEKMAPVLADAGSAITDQVTTQVAKTQEIVAAALARETKGE